MKPRTIKRDSIKNQQGFTVLETTIALVVMMIVGLAAAGGFVFAIRYNSAAADRAGSMAIAQSALEKFRAIPFTDSKLNAGTTSVTVTDSVARTYTLTTTVADKTIVSGKTTLKSITIQVTPVTSSGPLNTTSYDYYGSVKLFTERCNPLVGTNIH